MALFVNQENTRTKLQERIAAELAEKSKSKSDFSGGDQPDGVEDSAYLEGTKKTTSLAWAWVLIFLFIAGVIIYFAIDW